MLWRFASKWKTVITMTVFLHWIFGEMYDLDEFQLIRVEGRYYDNVYTITYMDNDTEVEFGQLKFNVSQTAEADNLHENGNPKVWISLNNQTLYTNDQYHLGFIATKLGLEPHNITTLDHGIIWRHIAVRILTIRLLSPISICPVPVKANSLKCPCL